MMSKVCMLIHGFTGTPHELKTLASYLESKGWICRLPTLPGHGGPMQLLRGIHRKQWLEAVVRESRLIAETYGSFQIVGFSMGGLLAAYAANRYPVSRLVLLNAAVIYVSPMRLMRDLWRRAKEKELSYYLRKQSTPLPSMLQFAGLVRELKREFRSIEVPTLIVQGELDQVVHPLSARYIYRSLRAERRLRLFPRSRHMICLDEEANLVFEEIAHFLGENGPVAH